MDTLKPSLIGELLSRFDDLLAEAQYPRECVASVPSEIANRSFPNDARTLNAMNESADANEPRSSRRATYS